MQYETFTTNDNARLAYQTSIPSNEAVGDGTATTQLSNTDTCIILLHGFSGSSAYFTRNTPTLAQHSWVVAPDMRGHGRSQHTQHGYHVARLAMDLHELITQVILSRHGPTTRIYVVGCSIGAAVVWTYVELFTDQVFEGLAFVDQAPLQDRSVFGDWGIGLAHYGCYDEATMLAAQRGWSSSDVKVREDTYAGLVASCLGYRYRPAESGDRVMKERGKEDEEFFVGISRACDGVWLARLLADHTRYDHREAIELVERPVLVMAGAKSGCFSVEGMMESVRRAERNEKRAKGSVQGVVFESGHWMFWEEPERWNQVLLGWIDECEKGDGVNGTRETQVAQHSTAQYSIA